ncbi:hypothetical protein BU23DRAFT_636096 [Bimuria novae-zelandiae CBS 107.79]|uniref:Uncharacterized protein n=1 Tax=Bimuria novae-zelandiae CBS 107.79 TaxID=1447943 RepID=A0A6A5VBJ9_9PLEO|nr:hypothetical protein BU23DRAFT_636096 [Bimuria novae-zelandiae CBS 107.79]
MSEDALKNRFEAATPSCPHGYHLGCKSRHKTVDMNIWGYVFVERIITDFITAFEEHNNVHVSITPYQAAAKLTGELNRRSNLASWSENARLRLSEPEFDPPKKYTEEDFQQLCQSAKRECYRLSGSSLSVTAPSEQELGVLKEYRCNTDYLRRFWRVRHAESQAESTKCGDIVAPKPAADIHSSEDLKHAVEHHLDWRCRIPSSFISVFYD